MVENVVENVENQLSYRQIGRLVVVRKSEPVVEKKDDGPAVCGVLVVLVRVLVAVIQHTHVCLLLHFCLLSL